MEDFPVSIIEAASAGDSYDAQFSDCYVIEAANASDQSDFIFASPLTATVFRLRFPAFVNTQVYTDYQVDFYLSLASLMLNKGRWGKLIEYGQALLAAHFLALERQAGSNRQGVPGTVIGVLNSGSVDKVSYGRDVASVMEDKAGHWGMTTYGMQYLRFARIFGSGPVQVGAGFGFGGGLGSLIRDSNFFLPQSASEFAGIDQAWPGPIPGPW